MEEEKQVEQDLRRAEIFDALGHPTRIQILKVLSEGSLGFADLKKKTAIESSGHLQHHLTKLDGLIKTDQYGKYCLSDEGKDALLTIQTVENTANPKAKQNVHRLHLSRPIKLKLKSLGLILIVSLLIATTAVAVFQYNQIMNLNRENNFLNSANPEEATFYRQFGPIIPVVSVNSSFAPPITVYQALEIAFENQSLTKQILKGMVVYVDLGIGQKENITEHLNGKTLTITMINGFQQLSVPTSNYSDFSSNGTQYAVVWEIQTHYANSRGIPPAGFTYTLVDATTGKVLPNMMVFI